MDHLTAGCFIAAYLCFSRAWFMWNGPLFGRWKTLGMAFFGRPLALVAFIALMASGAATILKGFAITWTQTISSVESLSR